MEAEGKAFRQPGATRVDVSSGIDWFELHAEVDYGDATATLPQLLEALRRGDTMVRWAMAPSACCRKSGWRASLRWPAWERRKKGICASGGTRRVCWTRCWRRSRKFGSTKLFERVRQSLRQLPGRAGARAQPEGFIGQLRDYQREGVGWMEFLREFGFGGCLADDMGVGKTAQVLAVLEARRARGQRAVAGGGAEIADVQLARGIGPLHAAIARAGAHRTGSRCRS